MCSGVHSFRIRQCRRLCSGGACFSGYPQGPSGGVKGLVRRVGRQVGGKKKNGLMMI